MVFKRKKLTFIICITIGAIISIPFAIVRSNMYQWPSYSIGIIGVSWLLAVIGVLLFGGIKQYIFKDDRIQFSSFFIYFEVQIKDIDYIRCVLDSRGSIMDYELIFFDKETSPIRIDPKLTNKDGKSIITVMKDSYKMRVTRL